MEVEKPTKQTLKKYGISRAEYEDLLAAQDGECAICGKTLYDVHIDHSHESGKVRGLLCNTCNTRLLFAAESPLLRKAQAYLRKHKRRMKRTRKSKMKRSPHANW